MSLFVCSKCGCIDNTATSCYWALIRPCKNRIYDKSLKGYEGKPLCSECAAIEYSKGDEVVVIPGTWHGKFKKEWPTEEEKKHIDIRNKDQYSERNVYHMITKQDIQAAASYIFRSSFVSEDQARKAMVKAGNNATKILVKTFRGKLFKKAFERARRGKDISSFERQEKESGFNFLHNPNNGRMQSGHIIIDGIGLFKQIIHER